MRSTEEQAARYKNSGQILFKGGNAETVAEAIVRTAGASAAQIGVPFDGTTGILFMWQVYGEGGQASYKHFYSER